MNRATIFGISPAAGRLALVLGLTVLVLAVSVGLAGDALAGSPWVDGP